jgi:hypothetical protein
MKNTTLMLLTGLLVAFCSSVGQAQLIYSNNFSLGGAVTINGTAPTVANSVAGGTSTALWNSVIGVNDTSASLANGTVDASQNTVLLPFAPQSGYLYTLTASVTFSSNPGSWVSLGFSQFSPVNQTSGHARFTDTSVNGIDWMIVNPTTANEQFFAGPRTTPAAGVGSQNLANGLATYTLQLNLNTGGPLWTISSFINGTQLGTDFTFTANPTVAALGYGQNTITSGTGIQWNNLELNATAVPEPSALALTGVGLAMLVFVKRKKTTRAE